MAQHGDTVAGKKIELIVKDDAATAENTKRLAQEMIVRDKVNLLAGFSVTPTAFAVAPLATEAKIPMIVTCAGTSAITERSPYIVRTSFTLPQSSTIIADWALKNPDSALRRKRGRGRTPSPAPCADSVVRS